MGRARTHSFLEYTEHGRRRWRIGITDAAGKKHWRRLPAGTSDAKARATFDSWVEKSTTDPNFFGTLDGEGETSPGDQTLAEFHKTYFDQRKTRANKHDEARIRNHVLPVLGPRPMKDIKVAEIRSLVAGLKAAAKIANKTIGNTYGALKTMFKRYGRDERERCEAEGIPFLWSSPCTLEGDELPDVEVLSPRSRTPGAYTRDELVTLITDPRIPHDRRIFNALMLLTGMRHGEAAGLRWRVYDATKEPLGIIDLKTQYDGQPLKGRGEAGGKPRNIPVHPVLAFLLAEWKAAGFAKIYGRAPTPDDFMVPTRRKGKRPMNYRKPHASLESHTRDCEAVGIVARRDHDMRHTFASLTDDDGARREVIEKVTHNAKGSMLEHYTHRHWQTVCAEVAKLRIDLSPARPDDASDEIARQISRHGRHELPDSLNLPRNVATPTGIEPVLPT